MPVKVIVQIKPVKMADGSNALGVTEIQQVSSNITYVFPPKFMHHSHHKELFANSTVSNGIKGIAKVRNVRVTLPDDLAKLYFDEEENAVFSGCFLDEKSPDVQEKNESGDAMNDKLIEILQKLTTAPKHDLQPTSKLTSESDLNGIEKRMSLQVYSGRQKADEWLANFEAECSRCKVIDSVAKVKCMRLFLSGTAAEWHQATSKKLSETEYDQWKSSFRTVFTDRGWANVTYAYSFKYVAGSLVEYALKKEGLLLDVEKAMSETSRICHIVVGLPRNVVEKIDRDQIKSTDQLINELRRFEPTGGQKREERPKKDERAREMPLEKSRASSVVANADRNAKEPCYKCAAIGRPNLTHPPRLCRNSKFYDKLKEANLLNLLEPDTESGHSTDEPSEN